MASICGWIIAILTRESQVLVIRVRLIWRLLFSLGLLSLFFLSECWFILSALLFLSYMYNIRRGGYVFLLDYFIHIMYSAFKNIIEALEQIFFSYHSERGGRERKVLYNRPSHVRSLIDSL